MKKFFLSILLFLCAFILFVPGVNATVQEVSSFDSVTPQSNRKMVYYIGAKEIKIKLENKNFIKGVRKDADGNDTNSEAIFFKNELPANKTTYEDVATVILKSSAYYIDDNNARVYLNTIVRLKKVEISRFGSSCGKPNSQALYDVLSVNTKTGGISAEIWEYDNDRKKVKNEDRGNYCHANVHYTISFELKKWDSSSDEGIELSDKNIQYPWKISDLDQSDKSGQGYDGDYVESIKFQSGFSGVYYVMKDHVMNINEPKFSATEKTGEGNQPSTIYSTVLTYQYGDSAVVEWWGSGWVGTGIVSVVATPEAVYTGNICSNPGRSANVTCGSESNYPVSSTEGVKGSFLGIYDITYTKYDSCVTKLIKLTDIYLSKNGQCQSVSIDVSTILTESISLNITQPFGDGKNGSIYAGGGFQWNGASIRNNINWYYSYFRDGWPIFTVSADGSSNVYRDVSEVALYDNGSCSGQRIDRTMLEQKVWNQVENVLKSGLKNANLSDKFTSNDYNDATITNTVMPLNNTSNSSSVANSSYSYENVASLKNAYIHKMDAKVTYDSSKNGSDYIDGGILYYVPLKYTASNTWIKLVNQNLSIIGQNISFNATCTVPVKQVLYECKNDCDSGHGDVKVDYHYRTIDVNNPFPKASSKAKINETAQNWSEWYCGSTDSCTQDNNNKKRLRNTYSNYPDNPLYSVTINSSTASKIAAKSDLYMSWNGMNIDGTSEFVINNGIFKIFAGSGSKSYCGLGICQESCDCFSNKNLVNISNNTSLENDSSDVTQNSSNSVINQR